MAQNMVNLKIFNKNLNETRRFSIDESLCRNFLLITEKLQVIFPNLRGSNFKLTWKDNDGDHITITGDHDLITAFTEMNSNTKILYVESDEQNRPLQKNSSCPFGKVFDLKNMHALARQYLEPLMGATQESQTDNNSQAQMLVDLIKNATSGVLGKYPEEKKVEEEKTKTENCNSSEGRQPCGSQQSQTLPNPQPSADAKIAEGLAKLQEMGFKNDSGFLKKLLEHLDGNVESVVKLLTK